MLRFALLTCPAPRSGGARGRGVSGAGPDHRRGIPSRRHGGHRGSADGRFHEEDVHEGAWPSSIGRAAALRRDGGSRAGEARRLHGHHRSQLDLVIHPQLNELPVQDTGRLRAHPEHHHLLHPPTVKADAPWKTWQEFIAAAKANPGKLRVGSPGEGTTQPPDPRAVAGPRRLQDHPQVPFSGWGETSPALLGGPHRRRHGPARRGEAARRRERGSACWPWRARSGIRFFPEAPTGKEAGLGDGIGTWFVLTAPKGTPGARLESAPRLRQGRHRRAVVRSLMKSRGVDVDYKSGDKLRQELGVSRRSGTRCSSDSG